MLASLVEEYDQEGTVGYGKITPDIVQAEPSTINVAQDSVCFGAYDLEEGLSLLQYTLVAVSLTLFALGRATTRSSSFLRSVLEGFSVFDGVLDRVGDAEICVKVNTWHLHGCLMCTATSKLQAARRNMKYSVFQPFSISPLKFIWLHFHTSQESSSIVNISFYILNMTTKKGAIGIGKRSHSQYHTVISSSG